MSAAFLDDIFSIICLVVLTNLAEGNLDPVTHVVVPLIASFAFVAFGAIGSIYLPRIMPYLLDDTVINFVAVSNRTIPLKDEMHMLYLIVCFVFFSWIGDVIGSSLLGGFVAGMLFASVPRSHLVWDQQFKRINRWLLRIFFSSTVAFSINISDLFTLEAFWKGAVVAAVPCLLSKIMAGIFTGPGRGLLALL